jgi:hypothetical protein
MVLLVHYCELINRSVLFDTGTGNNRRKIDVNKIASAIGVDVAAALPAFHAFTGCDTVSAFVGKGKKRLFDLMCKESRHVLAFKVLGSSATDIPNAFESDLEKFVCSMYGCPKGTNTGAVRYQLFQSRYGARMSQLFSSGSVSGVDLSLLPPAAGCLRCHVKRANFQSYIWTHAHIRNPVLPSPVGCGWRLVGDGELQIDWNEESIMPQSLIDVLQEENSTPTNVEY